ncbi:MAG: hypothetical protein IJC57_03745 [Clostridia bacterium]|nr:hypothetical protein [Clostridia bacterium]
MFKIHYTITIFIYINYLKLYSLHKTHERMINMGGTDTNTGITKELETSAKFCSDLNKCANTVREFLFLIDWLKTAAKKKKGNERQLHVAKLSNNNEDRWNNETVPVLAGKNRHNVSLKDFVNIYCDRQTAGDSNQVMITRGAKRYSSLYSWVVDKCKALRKDLPPNVLQLSRATASTFTNLTNVIETSSEILGDTTEIEEDGLVGNVRNEKISAKQFLKMHKNAENDPEDTTDGSSAAPKKAPVNPKKIDTETKQEKWVPYGDEHLLTYLVKTDEYRELTEKTHKDRDDYSYNKTKFISAMKNAANFAWVETKQGSWNSVKGQRDIKNMRVYPIKYGENGHTLKCWAMTIKKEDKDSPEMKRLKKALSEAGVKLASAH